MSQFLQTIRFRIIAAFAVCTLVMVGNALFGMRAVRAMSENLQTAYTGNLIPVTKLAMFRIDEIEIRRLLWQTLVTQDKDNLRRVRDLQTSMSSGWTQYYSAGISSPEEQALADRIHTEAGTFRTLIDQEIDMIEKGDIAGAVELQRSTVLKSAEALNSMIQQDMELNLDQAKDFTGDSEHAATQMFWIALGMLAASALVCVGATIYLSKAISGPLNRSLGIANDIADGRLDRPIVIDVKGEFGALLDAMKRMSAQLSDTVRRIKTSSDSVTVASREIAAGNMELSSRTEEQAASVEETAATMTELAETVKQNADNARQANALSANARSMADASNDAVQAMVRTIGNISESSAKIADITTLIEGIAFQTNILALNAAVEAARAGEQGRGFAVVAGEVRSLAQRSSAAAKEIKDLIESSTALVKDGSRQAEEVGSTMSQVMRAIKQVSDIVGEISAASEEQSQGIGQMSQAISQIDAVTQQNAALVEESAAAAQALEEQAVQMTGAIAVFSLADMPAVAPSHTRPGALSASVAAAKQGTPGARRVESAPRQIVSKDAVTADGDWETF
ncbi:methyl-accepting chemotaxis protein [Burkholderia sp. Ac-20365]|uniref:methyl-accepting chemotaxis protein n=1 Tax=Burkholderia sp. Ac-20365 TaxID=2703897 RepID=UPI001F1214E2|nr:methyl-accepting chemotaxis protein [Burkholderia sp. Ac-20365]